MVSNRFMRWCRKRYSELLYLYPRPYYERFGQGMEQTFQDLLQERVKEEKPLFLYVLCLLLETGAGILKENIIFMTLFHKRIARIVLVVALILSVPLMAMQITKEVNWSVGDFIFMGTLLLSVGLGYEFITKKMGVTTYRVAVGMAFAAAFFLVWVNAAVGIIGEPGGPNLMYLVVVLVAIIGAALAQLESRGMTHAMFVTAFVQGLVPVIAVITNPQELHETPGVVGVFSLNTFFVLMWVGSALLFRYTSMRGSDLKRQVG